MTASTLGAILIGAAILCLGAHAFACDANPVYRESLPDGRTFAIFMTTAQVQRSPRWNDDGQPAMTWMAATRYLGEWAREQYRGHDDVKYYQIGIKSFECPDLKDHRFYLFHLVVRNNGVETYGGQHFAAVLLDGTVVGPREIK